MIISVCDGEVAHHSRKQVEKQNCPLHDQDVKREKEEAMSKTSSQRPAPKG